MRKLKNWYVEMSSIQNQMDGLLNLYRYIYDIKNEHPNHNSKKSTHRVLPFEKYHTQIAKNFINLQMKMEVERSLLSGKKASGRKASYGKSVMLSLPSGMSLGDDTNYKKLRNLILIRLVEYISKQYKLNYTKEQRDRFITNYILSTAHLQDTNNHINILVPNVFIDYNNNNKTIRVDLGKMGFSHHIKKSFNYVMLKYFNINYLDYKIQSQKTSKKPNSQYSHKLKQLQEQIKDFTQNTTQTIGKLEKRVITYLNRMNTAIEEHNQEKFYKNKQLVEKNISKIKEELENINTLDTPKMDISKFEKIKNELSKKDFSSYNNMSPSPNGL